MKKFVLLACLLLSSMFCQAQSNLDDMNKLKALNARFIHNFVTNDTVSHSKIIHSGFVCITSTGHVVQRNDYMNEWLHGFDRYVYWDYRNEDISIFGTTALVHSQNKYEIIKDGIETSGMSMYTDTYIKENGEWKCIQAQLCKVTPENFGTDETIVKKYDYRGKK